MNCQKIAFNSPLILKIYALRQEELRAPLGLNLFEEDLLAEQEELFFAAINQNELISCLQLRILNPERLKLRQMATAASYKGQGYGRQVVAFAEKWAVQNDYKCIELHARKVAQGFYEKLGYKKVGGEFLEVDIPHFKMEKVL